jgi:MoaA/NifB/PqqE/SkfB family radical SAM enzyme
MMPKSQYIGYIDNALPRFVTGWAADASDFHKILEVDILVDDQVIATCVADRYRADLLRAGMGDGRHSFSVNLPPQIGRAFLEIRARIKGSDSFLLCGSSNSQSVRLDNRIFIRRIATDIVNNCNLRCPFCLVDYSRVKSTELMTKDTFARMLPLMPAVPDGDFWLSCLHEPTLNPRLAEFLQMLPPDQRKKISFTTNLVRKLSESEFVCWAQSGIHHINVSFDTMDSELFSILRKRGRYRVFEENLTTMARIFAQYPSLPLIRYITMAFKSNLNEIPTIIKESHEKYFACENEIRYTYNVHHITDDFRRRHYLHKEDWTVLNEKLKGLPYRYSISYPPENYEELIEPSANYFDFDTELRPPSKIELPLALRGRHDGTLMIEGHEQYLRINVNSCADPLGVLRNLTGP